MQKKLHKKKILLQKITRKNPFILIAVKTKQENALKGVFNLFTASVKRNGLQRPLNHLIMVLLRHLVAIMRHDNCIARKPAALRFVCDSAC